MLLVIGGNQHGKFVDWNPNHRAWVMPLIEESTDIYPEEPIAPIGSVIRTEYYNLVRINLFGQIMWLWCHESYQPQAREKDFGQRLMETIFNETGIKAMQGSDNV